MVHTKMRQSAGICLDLPRELTVLPHTLDALGKGRKKLERGKGVEGRRKKEG